MDPAIPEGGREPRILVSACVSSRSGVFSERRAALSDLPIDTAQTSTRAVITMIRRVRSGESLVMTIRDAVKRHYCESKLAVVSSGMYFSFGVGLRPEGWGGCFRMGDLSG